jgi:hypothetical protein
MQYSGPKRGQIGLVNASPQELLGLGQPTDFVAQHVQQLGFGVRPPIGQPTLPLIPHALIRVQLRRVGWKGGQMQPSRTGQQLLHRIAPMNLAVIQQRDDGPVDLAQQMPEEPSHFFSLNVVLVQMAVKRTMKAAGADGDSGNGGEAIVTIPMRHDRRLSHRAPGLLHRRDQEEAAFVEKDDVGCQPRGVFFTRGQTVCFQVSMAAASRSMARRSGFWWLQPTRWSSLPT